MMGLLTASVSHELITPLKCISAFSTELVSQLTIPRMKYKAELIFSTSKMLLSQVKILLDKNLLDQKVFVP
jgi:K+-sensing histidine kinase KdpD